MFLRSVENKESANFGRPGSEYFHSYFGEQEQILDFWCWEYLESRGKRYGGEDGIDAKIS